MVAHLPHELRRLRRSPRLRRLLLALLVGLCRSHNLQSAAAAALGLTPRRGVARPVAQTIIECIKMALTGELPPDANRGKNFVHDPKVQANTETKAKIMMQFQTVNAKVREARQLAFEIPLHPPG